MGIGLILVGFFGPGVSNIVTMCLTALCAFLLSYYVSIRIERRRDAFIMSEASLISSKLVRNMKKPEQHKKFFTKLADTVTGAYSDVTKLMSNVAPDMVDVASFLAKNPEQIENIMRTYQVRKIIILIAGFIAMGKRQRICAISLLLTELVLDPRTTDFFQKNVALVADGIFTLGTVTGLTKRSTDNPVILAEAQEIEREILVNHAAPTASDQFNISAMLKEDPAETGGFIRFMESTPHLARFAAISLLFLFHLSGIADTITDGLFTKCVNSTAQLAKMFIAGKTVYSELGGVADTFLGTTYEMFGAKYETPTIKKMNQFNDRINALWDRVKSIKDAVKSDPLGAMREDRPAVFMNVILSLQHEVKSMDEHQVNMYKFKNRLDEIYNVINELSEIRRSLLCGIGGKQNPVIVYFAGLKNSGKTHLFNRFNQDLARSTGLSLYPRTAHDKYWSNYQGQGIVALDDFAQDKEDEDHRTLLKYGTEGAQDVIDAAVQNKGKPFVSQFMNVTSNFTWIRKSETMRVLDALNRRRDYTIYVDNPAHLKWVRENGVPHADEVWWGNNPSDLYLVKSEFDASEENPVGEIMSHPAVIQKITYDQLLKLALAKERYYRAAYIKTIAAASERIEGLTVPPLPQNCSYSDTLSERQKELISQNERKVLIPKNEQVDTTSSAGDPPKNPFKFVNPIAKTPEKITVKEPIITVPVVKIQDATPTKIPVVQQPLAFPAIPKKLKEDPEWDEELDGAFEYYSSDAGDDFTDCESYTSSDIMETPTKAKPKKNKKNKKGLKNKSPTVTNNQDTCKFLVRMRAQKDVHPKYEEWDGMPKFSNCLYNSFDQLNHGVSFKRHILEHPLKHLFVEKGMLSIDAAVSYIDSLKDKDWVVNYVKGDKVYTLCDHESLVSPTKTYFLDVNRFNLQKYKAGTKIILLNKQHFTPYDVIAVQTINPGETVPNSPPPEIHSETKETEATVKQARVPYPNSPAVIRKSFPILVLGPSGTGKTAAFETSGIPEINRNLYEYTYTPYPNLDKLHDIVILDDITLDSNRWDEARTIIHLYHEGKLPRVTAVYATGNTTSRFYKSLDELPDEKNLLLRRCKVVTINLTRRAQIRTLFTPLHDLLKGLTARERNQYINYEVPEGGIGELDHAKRPMSTFPNFLRMALYEHKNDTIEVMESMDHTFAMPMPSNYDFMCQLPFSLQDEERQKQFGDMNGEQLLPFIVKNIKVTNSRGDAVNGTGMLVQNRHLFRMLACSYARAHTVDAFVTQFNVECFKIDYNVSLLVKFNDCLIGFTTQNGRIYCYVIDETLTGWKITDGGVKTPTQFFPLNEENRAYHQILTKLANNSGEFNHVPTVSDEKEVREKLWSQTPTYQLYSKYVHYFGFAVTIIATLGLFWPVSDSTGSEQTELKCEDEAIDTKKIDDMIEELDKIRKELADNPEKGKARYNKLKDNWKQKGIYYNWRNGKNHREAQKEQPPKVEIKTEEKITVEESSPYYPNTEKRISQAEYDKRREEEKNNEELHLDPAYRTQEELDIQHEREEELRTRREEEEQQRREDWEEKERSIRAAGRKVWADYDSESINAEFVEESDSPVGSLMFHQTKGFGIKGDLKIHYVKKNLSTRNAHTVCVDDYEGWRMVSIARKPIVVTSSTRSIKWVATPIPIQWPLITGMSGKFFTSVHDANTLFVTTMLYGVPIDLISRTHIPAFNNTIEMVTQAKLPKILIDKANDMHTPFVTSYVEDLTNEGTMDPMSLSATENMACNIVEVLNERGDVLCNGIGLGGSKLITVNHIANSVTHIRRVGTHVQVPVILAKAYRNYDIAVFTVVGQSGFFKEIVSRFITNDDFARLTAHNNRPIGYFSIYSTTKSGMVTLNNQLVEFAFNTELKAGDDGNYFQTSTSCQANGVSRVGDCGNPIFLIDKSQSRKMMGMHKKGNERRSVSTIITMEFARNMLNCEDMFNEAFGDVVPNRNVRYNSQIGFFNKGQPLVGRVWPPERIPDKTRRYRTGFKSPQGDKFEPAIMSINDPRNPTNKDFLTDQVKKYSVELLDEKLRDNVREAFTQIANELVNTFVTCGLETETLNTTQLLNGDRFKYEFMKPVDRSGSVGFGYTKLGYGTTKGDFMEQKDEIWRMADHSGAEKVSSDLAAILAHAANGEQIECPYIAYAKDECVGLTKIYGEKAKTRAFYAGDMASQLAFRKMFQSFYARLSECLAYHPVKIGISANGGGWEDLYYNLASVSDKGWCADAKNWDSHMPQMFMEECVRCINMIYQETDPSHQPRDSVIRTTLHKNVEAALVVLGGDVIRFENGGQISGFPGTAPENSLIHWALSYIVYKELAIEHGLKHLSTYACYRQLIGTAFYGDDSINTVHPSVQSFFTLPNFIRVAAKYGFEFTPSDKGDIVSSDFQKLLDMDFLKRGFKRYNGQVVGPIAINSIAKHAEWIKGQTSYNPSKDGETDEIKFLTSNEKAIIADSIVMIWPELALHGPETYQIWKRSFLEQEKRLRIGISIPTFDDALRLGGAYL